MPARRPDAPAVPQPPTAEAAHVDGFAAGLHAGASVWQRALVGRLCAVAQRLADDDALTMDTLALGVGLSRASLYRQLRGGLVGTPGALLMEIRLVRAADLLRAGAQTIGGVAYAVGFRGASHFSARFLGRYGVTPSAYAAAATRRRAHGAGPARGD